jgi:hypothetical protein
MWRAFIFSLLVIASRTYAATLYVNSSNPSPAFPFTTWATAATNIQDAIDSAVEGDQVLVTNGVYNTGNRTAPDGSWNRVVITNGLTLSSVNGSAATVIDGGRAMRCVILTSGAAIKGFTLTNGTEGVGGGAYCPSTSNSPVANTLVSDCLIISNFSSYGGGIAFCTVSNCIVTRNTSTGSGGGTESCHVYNSVLSSNVSGHYGGGASGGFSVLDHCIVFGNTASGSAPGGGGVFGSTLYNCLVVSNFVAYGPGSGTYGCTLNNCTICGNSSYFSGYPGASGSISLSPFNAINNTIIYNNTGGNWSNLQMTNSCTTPLPPGMDNITNAPLFANLAAGDFHLAPSSPCINAGRNGPVTWSKDLDGNQRVIAGTVDLGCYEFQSPASVLSYAWAQQYNLPIDGSADFQDSDGDGMNNWQEWIAGTNPTNPASLLLMLPPSNSVSGVTVRWQSVANRTYLLQRATALDTPASFSTIQGDIAGQKGTRSYTDTNTFTNGPYFYRVGIQQ